MNILRFTLRKTNQACRRLYLEPLEDRCVPSTVTNLTDHDPGSIRDAIAITPPAGTIYTTLDIPGASVTPTGVNDASEVVGYCMNASGTHGFFWDGNYTLLDFPGSPATVASGINNSGQIVGYFVNGRGFARSFMRDPSGDYTELIVPGAETFGSQAFGINDAGVIAGIYFDDNDRVHGFLATPVP